MTQRYDAFISYSHAADGRLAPAIETGLTRLAKPWYRLRALNVFRDRTNLGVRPELWAGIESALHLSRFLIIFASPQAAASKWVRRELDTWLTTHDALTVLVVLTDGELTWDGERSCFDPQRTTALPPRIVSEWASEPLWLDLRWAKSEHELSLRHARFRDAVCQLAAPLRNIEPALLDSEDVRLHRNARRIATAGIIGLASLATVASLQTVRERWSRQEAERQTGFARDERDRAEREKQEAERQKLEADRQRTIAERQTSVANTQRDIATSRELSARAILALNVDPEQTLRLGLNAASTAPTEQAEDALRQGLARSYLRWEIGHLPSSVEEVQMIDSRLALLRMRSEIQIWDVEHRRLLRRIDGRAVDLRCDRAQDTLAVARERDITVYPLSRGGPPASIAIAARSLDFAPDGQSLVILTANDAVLRWPFRQTGAKAVELFRVENGGYLTLDRGGAVVAITEGQRVGVWTLGDGARKATLTGRPDGYGRLEFSADGRMLLGFGALDNREAGVWEWAVQKKVPGFYHTDTVRTAAFSPNGLLVATGDDDGHTRLYETGTGTLRHELAGHMGSIQSVEFSPRGDYLVSVSADRTARLWDVSSGRMVAQLLGHDGSVRSAAFERDGKYILTGSADGAVRFWDVVGSRPDRVFVACERTTAYANEIDHDVIADFVNGDTSVRTSVRGQSARWNARTAARLAQAPTPPSGGYRWSTAPGGTLTVTDPRGRALWTRKFGRYAVNVMVNDRWAVVTTDEPQSYVLDVRSGDVLGRIPDRIERGWFTADGQRLIGEASASTLGVWRLPSGRLQGELRGHTRRVATVAFSNDQTLALTAADDGTALLWDARTFERVGELRGHLLGIRAAAFSPDGRFVATASTDRTTRVWEVATRRTILELRGHDAAVTSVAFSEDGNAIVTGAADCAAMLYRWNLGGGLADLVGIAQQQLAAIRSRAPSVAGPQQR
jgi:WD40 repeat protein